MGKFTCYIFTFLLLSALGSGASSAAQQTTSQITTDSFCKNQDPSFADFHEKAIAINELHKKDELLYTIESLSFSTKTTLILFPNYSFALLMSYLDIQKRPPQIASFLSLSTENTIKYLFTKKSRNHA